MKPFELTHLVLIITAGCGPTYMGPPPTLQPPPTYSAPRPAPISPRPAVPPNDSTARSLGEIPDVGPNEVYLPPRPNTAATYHRVQPGESLASLAKRYGVTSDALRKANAWSSDPQLRDGDLVLIPK